MTCLLIGEQLLHKYDITQTLGADWPIEAEPGRLPFRPCCLSYLPWSTETPPRAVDATYELTVHGGPR